MPSISIREATEEDLPALLALHGHLATDKDPDLSLDKARQLFDRIIGYPDYRIYVVTVAEEVIGTFALLIMDNLAHGGSPSGVVEDVVVDSNWQRRGVGKQMMDFAMDRCRDSGCYKLVLSTNATRKAAHRFYESLGFTRHGYSYRITF